MPFELQRVSLAAVDTTDGTYRLGRPRDVVSLAASIARLGLLCAPLLSGTEARWTVISGFSRVAACRLLGWEKMPARRPREAADPWHCAQWAVAEKAAERPLEMLETGRALRLLRRLAPDENAFARTVRHFGLPDQPAAQSRMEDLCSLPEAIQAALSDGALPANSNDHDIPRMTWWPHQGTTEWVQYDFKQRRTVSEADLYWFDDTPTGGGCRIPASWKLLYQDGGDWKEVADASAYGVQKDRFNTVTFGEVMTSALRIEVQLQEGYSSGILEWRVR